VSSLIDQKSKIIVDQIGLTQKSHLEYLKDLSDDYHTRKKKLADLKRQ
jgi:hypothetical protein